MTWIFAELWPHVATLLAVTLSVSTSFHAILRKRDTRAAVGWVALSWLVPFLGALLYLLLGINRINRRAKALRATTHLELPPRIPAIAEHRTVEPSEPHLAALARVGSTVSRAPLLGGNTVEILDGRSTYGAMQTAIDAATTSVALCSYIFDDDPVGRKLGRALADATQRGVQVRVLLDAVGVRYSHPPITRWLRRHRVPTALFLPTWVPAMWPFLNLRNHRKILVVDGRVAFTGGMNIREQFARDAKDLHFRLTGPVVEQLMRCFADDWGFATGERLSGPPWFPPTTETGCILARGIAGGPDEDFGTLRHVLLAAAACAQHSLRILTPYFLPDTALANALGVAALRGVKVDIVLPERCNLPFVQWAGTHQLWEVLEPGCQVYLSPPPFDHGKLVVVDEDWALIGSSNWDPRSLRLNFEFNVELYGREIAQRLAAVFDERRESARAFTLYDLNARPFPVVVRDGVARLFAPYL